jgi:hypothetical protein
VGKDGALEFVDMAAKRHKDNMGGWKEFRPHERLMVDEMVSSPCHIICTMRTKTDYVEQVDSNGKKKRVKIGLAPVQREGLEYEFDLVGYMDEENTFITDKTRCSHYSQKAFSKPGPKEFAPFVDWLKGEACALPLKPAAEPVIDTGGHSPNSSAAAQHVAAQKIAAGSAKRSFAAKREEVGEVHWRPHAVRNAIAQARRGPRPFCNGRSQQAGVQPPIAERPFWYQAISGVAAAQDEHHFSSWSEWEQFCCDRKIGSMWSCRDREPRQD